MISYITLRLVSQNVKYNISSAFLIYLFNRFKLLINAFPLSMQPPTRKRVQQKEVSSEKSMLTAEASVGIAIGF